MIQIPSENATRDPFPRASYIIQICRKVKKREKLCFLSQYKLQIFFYVHIYFLYYSTLEMRRKYSYYDLLLIETAEKRGKCNLRVIGKISRRVFVCLCFFFFAFITHRCDCMCTFIYSTPLIPCRSVRFTKWFTRWSFCRVAPCTLYSAAFVA